MAASHSPPSEQRQPASSVRRQIDYVRLPLLVREFLVFGALFAMLGAVVGVVASWLQPELDVRETVEVVAAYGTCVGLVAAIVRVPIEKSCKLVSQLFSSERALSIGIFVAVLAVLAIQISNIVRQGMS